MDERMATGGGSGRGVGGAADRADTRPPVWHGAMTAIALCGLALAFAASFVDARAIAYVRLDPGPWVSWFDAVTDVALVQWYLVPAGLVVLYAVLKNRLHGGTVDRPTLSAVAVQALYAFLAIGLAQLLTRALKFISGRARPALLDEGGTLQFDPFTWNDLYWSFPSGHSTTAGALAAILALWFPQARMLALAAGALLASTRVAADAHYPSDVVAGFTVGLLFALALARGFASRGVGFRFDGEALFPAILRRRG